MSILQTLRERAGALVAGVIGLSLLIFVVSDFFDSNTTQRRKAKKYYELARIDGQSITYQDFETKRQELVEIYKMSGTTEINEQTDAQIREQIWQQLLADKLMGKVYSQTGIGVSDEEVEMLVFGENPHAIVKQLFADPQTGMLNKSFLINFLKATETDDATKKYWLFFEDQIINDRLNTKLINLISKGLYITKQQSEFESNLVKQSVNFSYAGRNYSAISDSTVNVTSDEIRKYYESHKKNYKRTPQRDMEYIAFNILPSESDRKESETMINNIKSEFATTPDPLQFINQNADTRHTGFYKSLNELPVNVRPLAEEGDKSVVAGPFFEDDTYKIARIIDIADRPDSVRAAHILLSPGQTRTMTKARAQADSLMQLIREGIDFNILAMANSDDQGSAQVGGDLGWFSEGMMIVPFNNACFSGKKGDIVKVETSFGVHIIKILDQSKKVRKYDIGIVDRKVIASDATLQNIYSEAIQFAGNNDTYEKFNQAVAAGNLDKKMALNIDPEQKELPGLEESRGLIMALFQFGEKGKIVLDGNDQVVFELGDKYVVAYCTRIQEEGIAPVESVASEIRFLLAKEKKGEAISAEMNKLIGEGKTLYDIASRYNTNVQDASGITFRSYSVPGAGVEPGLIAAASASQTGVLSKPVEGNNGVYVYVVNSTSPSVAEDIKLVSERLTSNYQIRASYEAFEAFKTKKEVVDHRYRFY